MSRFEEFIMDHCPNGVEYVSVGELCSIQTGSQLNRETLKDVGEYPVYNGGINPSGYHDDFNTEANTIAISQGGASAGFVNWVDVPFFAGAHCYTIKNISKQILNRYLYFYLKNEQDNIQNSKQGAGIPGLNSKVIKNLRLPLPPLPVQQEIIRILDNFTELTSELTSELTAREKQYEYYRNNFLSFNSDVPRKSLSLLCKIGDGLHGTPKYSNKGTYAFINGNNLNGKRIVIDNKTKLVDDDEYHRHGIEFNNKTVFMSINGTIGNLAIYDGEKIVLGKSAAYFIITSDSLNLKFLYYMLQTSYAKQYFSESITGSTIKNLGLKALRGFNIPLPSIKEQERIVSILDRFDTLCNDLTCGLPAEIEARRKQYEYYRDKLLTFKEASA